MSDAEMAELKKKLAARPRPPVMQPDVETAVIKKYKALPQDRKNIIKVAMQHPCAYCEKEFNVPNTGKSHGICPRHFREATGTESPGESQTIDLAVLSPEERKLLVYLFTIMKKRQTTKGTFEEAV